MKSFFNKSHLFVSWFAGLFCFSLPSHGQTVNSTTWQQLYGYKYSDSACSIIPNKDGTCFVAGESYDIPEGCTGWCTLIPDFYVLKLDSQGNSLWDYYFGGSYFDYPGEAQSTSDGGYVIAGTSFSKDIPNLINNGCEDNYVVKLDANGKLAWHIMFGGSYSDILTSIDTTSDGGYVIAGCTESTNIPNTTSYGLFDYYIAKLDSTGKVLWQKIYGGNDADYAKCIRQTKDGGYIVVGASLSTNISGLTNHGLSDIYIIKLDSNGNLQWQKMLAGNKEDSANEVQQTRDGGYIIAGITYSTDIENAPNHGKEDARIIKLDRDGIITWQKVIGGADWERAESVQQIGLDNYIIGGFVSSTNIPELPSVADGDVYALKLNRNGSVLWQKNYGGSSVDFAAAIRTTSDGGFAIAGYSQSTNIPGATQHGSASYDDVYVIKTDRDGNL